MFRASNSSMGMIFMLGMFLFNSSGTTVPNFTLVSPVEINVQIKWEYRPKSAITFRKQLIKKRKIKL